MPGEAREALPAPHQLALLGLARGGSRWYATPVRKRMTKSGSHSDEGQGTRRLEDA